MLGALWRVHPCWHEQGILLPLYACAMMYMTCLSTTYRFLASTNPYVWVGAWLVSVHRRQPGWCQTQHQWGGCATCRFSDPHKITQYSQSPSSCCALSPGCALAIAMHESPNSNSNSVDLRAYAAIDIDMAHAYMLHALCLRPDVASVASAGHDQGEEHAHKSTPTNQPSGKSDFLTKSEGYSCRSPPLQRTIYRY